LKLNADTSDCHLAQPKKEKQDDDDAQAQSRAFDQTSAKNLDPDSLCATKSGQKKLNY